MAEAQPGVENIAAFLQSGTNLSGEGEPVQVPGLRVTAGFFEILGVPRDARPLRSIGYRQAVAVVEGGLDVAEAERDIVTETLRFAKRIASGATLAHGAHKALLRAWSVGGIAAVDDSMFDLTAHILESRDTERGVKNAVEALLADKPRPILEFDGN